MTISTHRTCRMCCRRSAPASIRTGAKSNGRWRSCRGTSATPNRSDTAAGGQSSRTTVCFPRLETGERTQRPSTAFTRPRSASGSWPLSQARRRNLGPHPSEAVYGIADATLKNTSELRFCGGAKGTPTPADSCRNTVLAAGIVHLPRYATHPCTDNMRWCYAT